MNFFYYILLFVVLFATAFANPTTPDPTTACGPCITGQNPDCPPNTSCYAPTQECYPNVPGGSCF